MLDIGAPEFLVLLVLAVILFGPERLPDLARKAARVIRYIRTMANNAQEELGRELGPGFEDIDVRDLNPKTFIQKHLLEDVEPIVKDVKADLTDATSAAQGASRDVTDADQRVQVGLSGWACRDGGRPPTGPSVDPVRSRRDVVHMVRFAPRIALGGRE